MKVITINTINPLNPIKVYGDKMKELVVFNIVVFVFVWMLSTRVRSIEFPDMEENIKIGFKIAVLVTLAVAIAELLSVLLY